MYYQITTESPVGTITIACDEEQRHITGLWIEGQKYFLGTLKEMPKTRKDIPILEKALGWLDNYFAGKNPEISELPLAPIGSAFRQDVWKMLCEIPYGSVTTYGEIARKMAAKMGREKMSARAVGGAVAHNPISIIIPCHRVVGTNGSLTGYAGGIDKKIKLLEMEKVLDDVTHFRNIDRNTQEKIKNVHVSLCEAAKLQHRFAYGRKQCIIRLLKGLPGRCRCQYIKRVWCFRPKRNSLKGGPHHIPNQSVR